MVGNVKFEVQVKEVVENFPDLAALVETLPFSGGCFVPDRHLASPSAGRHPGQ